MNNQIKHIADALPWSTDVTYEELQTFADVIIENCAKRTEAYAYMSPNFIVLAEELRNMKTSI